MKRLLLVIVIGISSIILEAMQQEREIDPRVEEMLFGERIFGADRKYVLDRIADLHLAIDSIDSEAVKRILDRLKQDEVKERGKIAHFLALHGMLGGERPLTRIIKKAKGGTNQQLAEAQTIITLLMQDGADINLKNQQGNTPAQLAAGSTLLLEALSSNLLNQLLMQYQRGNQGAGNSIVERFAPVLHSSINSFDSARVEKLLSTISRTPGTGQVIKNLVNLKVQDDTALHTAVKKAKQISNDQQFEAIKDIMQLLLSAGADPSIANKQGLPLVLLLDPAPGVYQIELIKLFVQASGRALFDAITRADTASVESILGAMQKRGNAAQTLNTMTNDAGQTPLIYALSLVEAAKDPARKQQLLYSAQYLINAGATLEQQPQARKQFSKVIKFLTGL